MKTVWKASIVVVCVCLGLMITVWSCSTTPLSEPVPSQDASTSGTEEPIADNKQGSEAEQPREEMNPPTETGSNSLPPPNIKKIGAGDEKPGTFIQHLWVGEKTLLACSATQGLLVYDISTPSQPKLQQTLSLQPSSSSDNHCAQVTSDGNVAYTLSKDSTGKSWLTALQKNGSTWERKAQLVEQGPVLWSGLTFHQGKVYVAARSQGVLVFKQDNQTFQKLEEWKEYKDAWALQFQQARAFLADGIHGFKLLSLSNDGPKLLSQVDLKGVATQVAAQGENAYVALGPDGYAAINIKDLTQPKVQTFATDYAILDIAATGSWVVVSNLFDVQTHRWQDINQKPTWVGRIALPNQSSSSTTNHTTLGLSKDWLFVGTSDGLQVVRYNAEPSPILTLSQDVLHFGHVKAETPQSVAIVLFNKGQKELKLSGFQVQGKGFKVGKSPTSLKPGDVNVVELTYQSKTSTLAKGTLTFTTNDPVRPRVELPMFANPLGGSVGEVHPAKTWTDLQGQQLYSTSSLRGKVVLLVYFATWCTECNASLPLMEKDLWQPLKDKDFVILAIAQRGFSGDSGSDLRGFVKQSQITFPVVLSLQFEPIYPLGKLDDPAASPYPVNVLLNRKGTIAHIARKYDAKAMKEAIDKVLKSQP